MPSAPIPDWLEGPELDLLSRAELGQRLSELDAATIKAIPPSVWDRIAVKLATPQVHPQRDGIALCMFLAADSDDMGKPVADLLTPYRTNEETRDLLVRLALLANSFGERWAEMAGYDYRRELEGLARAALIEAPGLGDEPE
jgi:hypothetical protein